MISRKRLQSIPGRLGRWAGNNRDLLLAWGLVALLAAFAAWQVLPRPVKEAVTERADEVIVLGAEGLTWSDITEEDTPNLYRIASRSDLAELELNSGHRITCTDAGWLTLSAGAPAVAETLPSESCGEEESAPELSANGEGASIVGYSELYELNRTMEQNTRLGTLAAASGECTAAVGTYSAYGAANGVGRIEQYRDSLPEDDLADFLASCPLTLVDGSFSEGGDEERLAELDALAGRLDEARSEGSALVVAGLGAADDRNRLQTLMIDSGGDNGLLDTAGERPGHLKLTDLTATLIALLGSPQPDYLAANPAGFIDDPYDFPDRLASFSDSDQRLSVAPEASSRAQWLQAALLIALAAVALPLMRLLRRAGQPGVKPPSIWLMRADILIALVCALFSTATLLTDLFKWWALPAPTVLGPLLALLVACVLAVGAALLPRRHSPSTLLAIVSALGVAVSLTAMAVHYKLAMGTLLGDASIARTTSQAIGPAVAGIYIGSLWMLAAAIAWNLHRRYHAPVMAAIGCLGVAGAATPVLGNSSATAVALIVGTCLAAALAYGGWMTAMRLLWSLLAGGAVLLLVLWLDYRRPTGEQGPLGEVVTDLLGESNGVISDATGSNLVAVFTSPLSVVALIAGLYCWMVLLRPGGGLRRSFGLHPPLRAAFTAAVVSSLVTGILAGRGLMVLGVSLAVIVPLSVIVAHRVLARAHVKEGQFADMTVDAPSWVDGDLDR
ncbi:hypothetical protein [Salininema proteolyticum]|uniref:Uncharacterized protein n=1 Tax=Salininema proteolyticum TaxID=1607685 RepID=A0ABV8TZZ8_9ACTN